MLQDLPEDHEAGTEKKSSMDGDTFDAENFAAVLSAHNSQVDQQHYAPAEGRRRTENDEQVDTDGGHCSTPYGPGGLVRGLGLGEGGDDPYAVEANR